MIVRKPYAFLIKHFKLIHFFLFGFMLYLSFKTTNVLKYVKTFIGTVTPERDLASNYISIFMFISIIFILFISIVIYFLMRYKKKPKTIYFLTILGYVILFGIYIYSYSILSSLEIKILDQRTLILTRDILNVSLLFQYVLMGVILIRALGFDIKKFHFAEDLQELDIDVTDNEEVELTVGVDTDKIIRKVRKNTRLFKYFILENKLYFLLFGSLFIIFLIFYFCIYIFVYQVIYREKEEFRGSNFAFYISDSYLDDSSYNGKVLTNEEEIYVIVSYHFSKINASSITFDPNDFKLLIGDQIYSNMSNLCSNFYDIGSCYQEKFYEKGKEYVLVFKIPKKESSKKMILRYLDTLTYKVGAIESKYKKVRLEPEDLSNNVVVKEVSIGEELSIKDSLLQDGLLHITDVSINQKFSYPYQSCFNGNCYEYTGVISSTGVSLTQKTILKLDFIYQNSSLLTLNKLVLDFGAIHYSFDNKEYVSFLQDLTPNNFQGDSLFLEVDSLVQDADKIWLVLTIRNKTYHYILK